MGNLKSRSAQNHMSSECSFLQKSEDIPSSPIHATDGDFHQDEEPSTYELARRRAIFSTALRMSLPSISKSLISSDEETATNARAERCFLKAGIDVLSLPPPTKFVKAERRRSIACCCSDGANYV
jgi:hypothetical protein